MHEKLQNDIILEIGIYFFLSIHSFCFGSLGDRARLLQFGQFEWNTLLLCLTHIFCVSSLTLRIGQSINCEGCSKRTVAAGGSNFFFGYLNTLLDINIYENVMLKQIKSNWRMKTADDERFVLLSNCTAFGRSHWLEPHLKACLSKSKCVNWVWKKKRRCNIRLFRLCRFTMKRSGKTFLSRLNIDHTRFQYFKIS